MSKSYYVDGFKPADLKWEKMRRVWQSCKEAGVIPPKDVVDFFNGECPYPDGVKIDLKKHECCTEIVESGNYGFQVDLTKIPEGINKIRFVINY